MSVEHPSATIEHLLVAQGSSDFYTYPIPIAKFDVQDNHMVPNARHGGQTTLADVRCSEYVKKEDEIANLQSITVAESSQLDEIARGLELDDEAAFDSLAAKANQDRETVPEIVPRDYDETLERVKGMAGAPSRLLVAQALGLNIVFRDFQGTERTPNFEDLVPGMNAGPFDDEARKFSDATIFLIGPNDPCKPAGRKLQEVYGRPSPDFVRIFLESAAPEQRRGLIAMVSKGGFMATGQSVRFIPFRRR